MSVVESKITATKGTPEIVISPGGIIEIRGRSMMEDINEFSKQIEDWIEKFILTPKGITRVDFHLEYLNTNNIKFYISLLRKIEILKLKNKKLVINWYYEEGDEDIFEKGEYISLCLETKLNFIMLSGSNALSEHTRTQII
jgi:hypothetical protein